MCSRGKLLCSAAVAAAFICPAVAQTAPSPASRQADLPPEIVVTATKSSQAISKVPLSVAAVTQKEMDRTSIRSISDIARITPGVSFSTVGDETGNRSNIAIRGIYSDAGAPTTAIYIDDTPIQVRLLNMASNPYPKVFDLDRVEVLRGPQGTLFGASSEGGNVRFITPAPNLENYSVYAKSELAFTEHGAPSWEQGVAVGGPIVRDTLGFRVSGWVRRDGGYIDRVDADTGAMVDKNGNSQNSVVIRGALTWKPAPSLTITPAIFYQHVHSNDGPGYYPSLSDEADEKLRSGRVLAQPFTDRFTLSSLKAQYDAGPVSLFSISSYFDRKLNTLTDFTNFESAAWGPSAVPYLPGQNAYMQAPTRQKYFTQEVRAQSADQQARFTWIIGGFYSNSKITTNEFVTDYFLPQLVLDSTGQTLDEFFGQGLVDGRYTVTSVMNARDTEVAGFGQVAFKIFPKLTATAGARIARTKFKFADVEGGPINGPVDLHAAGQQSETPITPKFSLSYQADPRNLFYATAAKGYRPGGAQFAVPQSCSADFVNYGITQVPTTYKSDSLWSYELGAKNKLFGNRLQISSSAFYIRWNNIQQLVALPSCGYNFFANLGKATSKGFDTDIHLQITRRLSVGLAASYTDAEFSQTARVAPSSPRAQASKGDHLPGAPWTVDVSGEYDWPLVRDIRGYVRGEVEYQSRQQHSTVSTDPANGSYDAAIPTPAASTFVTLRAGTIFRGFDISVFADNVLNAHPRLSYQHDIASSTLFYASTFRPRTVGFTGTFRFH